MKKEQSITRVRMGRYTISELYGKYGIRRKIGHENFKRYEESGFSDLEYLRRRPAEPLWGEPEKVSDDSLSSLRNHEKLD